MPPPTFLNKKNIPFMTEHALIRSFEHSMGKSSADATAFQKAVCSEMTKRNKTANASVRIWWKTKTL